MARAREYGSVAGVKAEEKKRGAQRKKTK